MKKNNLFKSLATGLSLIRRLDGKKFMIMIMKALTGAVIVLVPMFLSAFVVEMLGSSMEAEKMVLLTVGNLAVVFLVSVFYSYLEKKNELETECCLQEYRLLKNKGIMRMSYAELESPAFKESLARIHAEESYGFGFPLLLQCLEEILKHGWLLLICIFLVPFLSGFGHPVRLILTVSFLGIAVAASLLVAAFVKKANDKSVAALQETFPEHIVVNDFLTYEGGIGYKELKDIHMYSFEPLLDGCYQKALEQMREYDKTGAGMPSVADGFSQAMKGITLCGSFLLVIILQKYGQRPLGMALLTAYCIYQMSAAISAIAATVSHYGAAVKSVQKYIDLFDQKIQEGEEENIVGRKTSVQKEEDILKQPMIEFCGVSFRYPDAPDDAVSDFSLKIRKNQKIALVGANGSGKSTVIKLLCGLYKPAKGEIKLADRPDGISAVFQDFSLFSLELGENIGAVTPEEAERCKEKIVSAIQTAGFGERFQTLPDGIHTLLNRDFGNGVDVSLGEAQRIALARAVYKDAPVIVLDEPTAALDPLAEYHFYNDINRVMENCTVIFVSHRLSACRFCDLVAVMDQGKLVDFASHEELLKKQNSKYCELWNTQAQFYQ